MFPLKIECEWSTSSSEPESKYCGSDHSSQLSTDRHKVNWPWALVANACSLSYSEGRDWEDCTSKLARANQSLAPILKKPITPNVWWSGSRYRPWVQKSTTKKWTGIWIKLTWIWDTPCNFPGLEFGQLTVPFSAPDLLSETWIPSCNTIIYILLSSPWNFLQNRSFRSWSKT
jgi:hypothetical protein